MVPGIGPGNFTDSGMKNQWYKLLCYLPALDLLMSNYAAALLLDDFLR